MQRTFGKTSHYRILHCTDIFYDEEQKNDSLFMMIRYFGNRFWISPSSSSSKIMLMRCTVLWKREVGYV